MPTFARSSQPLHEVEADVVAVFATKDDETPVLGAAGQAAAEALGLDLVEELRGVRFDGALAAVGRVPTRGALRAPLLLVVGLGPLTEVTTERVRRAAGAAVRAATKDAVVALAAPTDLVADDADEIVVAAVEGAGLGAYAFTRYKTKAHDVPSISAVHVLAPDLDDDAVDAAVAAGERGVRATSLARDLVNTPPQDKRPPVLADRIRELAEAAGLGVEVLDEQALLDGGFGGILGVGQGSSTPPRLVELTYEPADAVGHVVLVGKGITFDSGGLSLKPPAAMSWMKADMSGAAAIVGAMSVVAEAGVRVKVTGLLALAENMPSGTATRVSDVLVHRGGRTVEVMNTDAEGRLVLGDALAYGAERQPDVMLDLATLTGAQIVALGHKIAAVMGTDDAVVDQVRAAGTAAGEPFWPLPLPEDYADHLRSEVADCKNIGRAGVAGTIIGGLYLKPFTGDVPWAHLDIAGPAFSEDGDPWYSPKGATGVGVRTLLRFLAARGATAATGNPEAGATG